MTDTRKNTKISASVKKFAKFYGLKKNERGLIDCGDKYKFVLDTLKKRIVHINTLPYITYSRWVAFLIPCNAGILGVHLKEGYSCMLPYAARVGKAFICEDENWPDDDKIDEIIREYSGGWNTATTDR